MMADTNTLWQKPEGPSAGLVQEHYVKARLQGADIRNPALEKQMATLLENHPLLAGLKLKASSLAGVKYNKKKWIPIYQKINQSLRTANLTINFKAENWFSTENKYPSYTQMYERSASKHGGQNILEGDSLNPAKIRAEVDDSVTFPTAWSTPAPSVHRGLRPAVQSGQRIQSQMRFGSHTEPDGGKIKSLNPHFNPKTKQIFAALNYGRRPHGSTPGYGADHLVLHPRFNANAFYIAGDTFFIANKSTDVQMPFAMIAVVLLYARPSMIDAIIKSCYFDNVLGDLSDLLHGLLEAHIFGALPFTGNISELCLSAKHQGTVLEKNANIFANKHGARLRIV